MIPLLFWVELVTFEIMNRRIIVIPTYNEVENIAEIIHEIFSLPLPFSVLVVDDNSPDGTAQAVQQLQSQYSDRLFLEQRLKKEGLGPAYLHGFCWALPQGFEYVIQMDADFSHDPEALASFVASFEKGSDVVVGSRYSDGVTVVNWPISRILLSYFASQFVQLITRMPIKDPTAGYVGYRKTVLKSLDLGAVRYVGYAYQIEMKYKAWKKGFKLTEIPIVFKNRVKGHSKMSGQIIWEAFFGVLFLPLQNLFRKK